MSVPPGRIEGTTDDERPTCLVLEPDGDPAAFVDAIRAAAGLPPRSDSSH